MQTVRLGTRLQRCLRQGRFCRPLSPVISKRRFAGGSRKGAAPEGRSAVQKTACATVDAVQYCRECGDALSKCIPPADSRERLVCSRCGYIDYRNPKIIAGCLVEHEDRILLCLRGIEPCKGLWTLPAGFLEFGESTVSGAIRETLEEANAAVSVLSMFSMMDVPIIGQCHIMYRARLEPPFLFSPGTETLQTKLVKPEEIPLEQIAFTSIRETLKAYKVDRAMGRFRFHHGVIARKSDGSPSDASAYKLENYFVQ